jgi:hypothetical protein
MGWGYDWKDNSIGLGGPLSLRTGGGANGGVFIDNYDGTKRRVGQVGSGNTVGSMFQNPGVYAPRVGTADTMGRTTGTTGTTGTTSRTDTGSNFYTNASGQPSYFGLNTWEQMGRPNPNDAANTAADNLARFFASGSRTSSGAGNPYTNAIKILQKQLSGGGYGTSYDNLSTLLGTTATGAGQRIDNATASALAGLRSSDPMAAYQFNAGATQIPQTALNTYLNSIGASTSSVDAGRQLLQGMIDSQSASAGQYSAGNQQGFDLQRQAAQDALTGNQQYAQSQLALAQQAQQMAIAQAKEKERKAIEDQILAYVLKGGRA